MATSAVVVTGLLGDVVGETTDLTSAGFGTATAALLFVSAANSTNNPETNAAHTIVFWDGTNTRCVATSSYDNRSSDTRTSRAFSATRILATPVFDAPLIGWAGTISSITDGIRLTCTVDNTTVNRYVYAVLFKGTTNVLAGTYQLATGTSYDVTSIGFKPDLVFFSTIGFNSAPEQNVANAIISYGVAHNDSTDTVTQGVVAWSAQDGLTQSKNNQYVSNSYVVGQVFADVAGWLGSVGSFDANGFTITTTANPADDYIFYLALQLADPDDAWVGIIDSATTTGQTAYTGTGFTPEVVGVVASPVSTLDSVDTSNAFGVTFGLSDGTTEGSVGAHDEDALSVTNAFSEQSTGILQILFDDGTVDASASVYSLDTDGFTLDYTDGSATARKILAFAIGDSTAGGGAITGTGSVASQSSAIAGTAEREITGTSALESQSSTIAGTGAIGGAITGTAVLSAQSSTIAGTGTRVITSAAELVSQASVIAGAAERVITGTSGIEAQSSTITGTGVVAAAGTVTGTGDLDSQSSTISGTGILERTGTGTIAAGVASIDAAGIITRVGTGTLASQASSISGTGTVSTPLTITGTGSLVCGVSSISGSQQTPVWTAIARVETVWTEI